MQIVFDIPLPPVTKKNHGTIVRRGRYNIMLPSPQYIEYEKAAVPIIQNAMRNEAGVKFPLDGCYNVCGVYCVPVRRRVDLANLNNALHDVLVKAGFLVDDDCLHIGTTNGSHVQYDRDNPRTCVSITDCPFGKAW